MGSPVRSLGRLILYLGLTFALLPIQIFAVRFHRRLSVALPRFYHRQCCRILGFEIVTRGQICDRESTLFVSNHVSYIDILVLASMIPASFVAKAEVARWPFFGMLAKLQRTVFVDRRGTKVAHHRDEMIERLRSGGRLIMFPEGTSDDGIHILPFKSALFAAAQTEIDGRPIAVQPISIAYTRLDGMPIGRALKPHFAWYGDMDLAAHMWTLAGLGNATVEVIFHPPVDIATTGSRKALAEHCYRVVADGVSAANAGYVYEIPPLDAAGQPVIERT